MALASGISIAATAISVTHMDSSVPTIRSPKRIKAVLLPVRDRISMEIRFPNPELVITADRASTPIKNTTVSLPKPVFTASANVSILNSVTRMIPSRPVIWKGIGSVIHRIRQKTNTPKEALPISVSSAVPDVRIDSGSGSFMTNPITTSAAKMLT